MSLLYRWFSVEKQPYLPDPDEEKSENKAAEVREANKKVLAQLGKKDPARTTTMIWTSR